jgi:hypothetical protein
MTAIRRAARLVFTKSIVPIACLAIAAASASLYAQDDPPKPPLFEDYQGKPTRAYLEDVGAYLERAGKNDRYAPRLLFDLHLVGMRYNDEGLQRRTLVRLLFEHHDSLFAASLAHKVEKPDDFFKLLDYAIGSFIDDRNPIWAKIGIEGAALSLTRFGSDELKKHPDILLRLAMLGTIGDFRNEEMYTILARDVARANPRFARRLSIVTDTAIADIEKVARLHEEGVDDLALFIYKGLPPDKRYDQAVLPAIVDIEMDRRHFKEALDLLNRVEKIGDKPNPRLRLAWCRMMTGDTAQAAAELDALIRDHPDDPCAAAARQCVDAVRRREAISRESARHLIEILPKVIAGLKRSEIRIDYPAAGARGPWRFALGLETGRKRMGLAVRRGDALSFAVEFTEKEIRIFAGGENAIYTIANESVFPVPKFWLKELEGSGDRYGMGFNFNVAPNAAMAFSPDRWIELPRSLLTLDGMADMAAYNAGKGFLFLPPEETGEGVVLEALSVSFDRPETVRYRLRVSPGVDTLELTVDDRPLMTARLGEAAKHVDIDWPDAPTRRLDNFVSAFPLFMKFAEQFKE